MSFAPLIYKLTPMLRINKYLFLFLITAVFVSCNKSGDDDPTPAGGKATLQIRLTDSPAEYDAVLIDINAVRVHCNTISWQDMQTNAGVYNLLDLTNGVDTVICQDELPAGILSQIRFVLGDQNKIVVDGDTLALFVPSGETSGLKLNLHQNLEAGVSYSILIDFDAASSIIQTGNGSYKLKPVLNVVAVGIDGAIKGQLEPVTFARIYAIDETSSDTSGAFTNDSGSFLVGGLDEGSYRVEIWPTDPLKMKSINHVLVKENKVTNLGTIHLN